MRTHIYFDNSTYIRRSRAHSYSSFCVTNNIHNTTHLHIHVVLILANTCGTHTSKRYLIGHNPQVIKCLFSHQNGSKR